MTPSIDVQNLRALLTEHRGLPWALEVDDERGHDCYYVATPMTDPCYRIAEVAEHDDAAYLVAAANAVPALLARVRELEAALATARQS